MTCSLQGPSVKAMQESDFHQKLGELLGNFCIYVVQGLTHGGSPYSTTYRGKEAFDLKFQELDIQAPCASVVLPEACVIQLSVGMPCRPSDC